MPENVSHVQVVSSSARFILVVEKDATFQKILDSGVFGHLPPAIVITVREGEGERREGGRGERGGREREGDGEMERVGRMEERKSERERERERERVTGRR